MQEHTCPGSETATKEMKLCIKEMKPEQTSSPGPWGARGPLPTVTEHGEPRALGKTGSPSLLDSFWEENTGLGSRHALGHIKPE